VVRERPVAALIIAAEDDRIIPLADIKKFRARTEIIVVEPHNSTKGDYFFNDLVPPVVTG